MKNDFQGVVGGDYRLSEKYDKNHRREGKFDCQIKY